MPSCHCHWQATGMTFTNDWHLWLKKRCRRRCCRWWMSPKTMFPCRRIDFFHLQLFSLRWKKNQLLENQERSATPGGQKRNTWNEYSDIYSFLFVFVLWMENQDLGEWKMDHNVVTCFTWMDIALTWFLVPIGYQGRYWEMFSLQWIITFVWAITCVWVCTCVYWCCWMLVTLWVLEYLVER